MHGLRYLTGATLSPLAAFLILRGLNTSVIRMARHTETADAIARFLEAHPAVSRVHYPGLPSSPSYDLARRQMANGGGLVSFELVGGQRAGLDLMNHLKLVTRAVSLGDAETLIQSSIRLRVKTRAVRVHAHLAHWKRQAWTASLARCACRCLISFSPQSS